MILLVHLLLGAAIGHVIKNPALAIVLALFSHYFLDFFPHVEYPISNTEKKQWLKAIPEFLSIGFDFFFGVLLIFLFSNPLSGSEWIIIYICAFFAILPDGISVLNSILKISILKKHSDFHQKKIHFLRHKKISNFWRISSQIIAVAISFILLKI